MLMPERSERAAIKMQLAKIIGNVVSTTKSDRLHGLKLMIVSMLDLETMAEKGPPLVAIDTVGSGVGEVVMVVSGSSSRQTEMTKDKPTDLTIVAIIDSYEISGKTIFRKFEGRAERQL